MSPPDQDRPDAAEARLGAYLEELNTDPPRSDVALVKRVTHQARWQRAIRGPLQVAGLLAAAVFDGVTGLFGADRGTRR